MARWPRAKGGVLGCDSLHELVLPAESLNPPLDYLFDVTPDHGRQQIWLILVELPKPEACERNEPDMPASAIAGAGSSPPATLNSILSLGHMILSVKMEVMSLAAQGVIEQAPDDNWLSVREKVPNKAMPT